MANPRGVIGGDYVLAIDPLAGENYQLIVCLTSNGLERTSNEIDASSKCGPATIPGAQTIKVPFEFQDVIIYNAGEVSEADLHPLWQAKTLITWKFGRLVPEPDDITYYGEGYITQLNTTAPNNGIVTTTGSIAVNGDITQVKTGS